MNISTGFAPEFRLIVPFFKIGVIVYLFCNLLLFKFNVQTLHNLDITVLSWVHLFLLGFVMMIILGAMAQLIPVVLEVEHFAVDLYYVIYPLLFIGTLLMVLGFVKYPLLLPFGGVVAFISFCIFLLETFLTILKVRKFNFVISTVLIANLFLLFGLIVGILLALSYSGFLDINIDNLLKIHIYCVLFGYVGITIIGMSLILLPMFWLSHSFSWIYVKSSVVILCIGIIFISLASIFNSVILEYFAYFLNFIALFLYFYQIYIIYKKRVRIEVDIYFKSMLFSFLTLICSIILGIVYIFYPTQELLLGIFWLVFAGFISFIIIGHLYKIVPFLVWFQRFSPLVGKRKVPMLAQMIPVRSANFQFFFTTIGVLVITISIFSGLDILFKSGVSFLLIGTIFLIKDVFYMINFKEE